MIVQIRFDAFTDSGTGYTAEEQNRWLAESVAAVREALRRRHTIAPGYVPGSDVIRATAYAPDDHSLLVECCPGDYGKDAAKTLEAECREAVADALGNQAAYTTIYRFSNREELPKVVEYAVYFQGPHVTRGGEYVYPALSGRPPAPVDETDSDVIGR